jgi:radical SAM protein with 4Fe4S-binding SPASM domain
MLFHPIIERINDTFLIKRIAYFCKNILFCFLQHKNISQKINYFNNSVSCFLGLKGTIGSPTLLCIEPTNICDQKCTICETGLGILGREKKFLSFDQFMEILDQFDNNLEILHFYFMGEPFLNKDSYRMIQYAANRGIWVSSCTNGNHVDPDELMKSGIGEINFQIGGMTQEIHEIYRCGGNLKKVFATVEESLRIRDQIFGKNKKRPKINLGFILMKHNEHQVEEFIHYCKKTGVDNYNIIGTCLREYSQGHQLLPSDTSYWIYDEAAFKNGLLTPKTRPNNYCEWIYFTTTILVNGDVVPCCRDPYGKYIFGNVFNKKFYAIWNNEKYKKVREIVAKNSNNCELCRLCEGYIAPIILPSFILRRIKRN